MRFKLDIERLHYSVSIELGDDDGDDFEEIIQRELRKIENAIMNSSNIWHYGVSAQSRDSLEILPNGHARFHPRIPNRVDQLILLIQSCGTGGITTSIAMKLLNLPSNTITGYYANRSTKGLFKRLGDSQYGLTKEGLHRFMSIISMDEEIETTDESLMV